MVLKPETLLGGTLWGVVVTYRRPDDLRRTLRQLDGQSMHLQRLIVVDNGSESVARDLASAHGAEYMDAHDNLGPAGGLALGFRRVLEAAQPDDWVMVLDDDNPPGSPHLIEAMCRLAGRCQSHDPRTAAVGLTGARYEPMRGTVRRVPDEELQGLVAVDYLGGGQLPLYSVQAIQDVGYPDPGLFFGFEELDYGLRLREAGWSLYVDGDLWAKSRGIRAAQGKTSKSQPLNFSRPAASWRHYYSTRNIVIIAKRHGSLRAAVRAALLGATKGVVTSTLARRSPREICMPIRGAVDGLRGRQGRTVDPANAAK